jgi:II/X family phage/plasmid replication protein
MHLTYFNKSKMLDLLNLRIYFHNQHISTIENNGSIVGGTIESDLLLSHGIKLAAGQVENDEQTGKAVVSRLYHPFESIPSSNSTLAFKIRFGSSTYFPHIELKASPAKLMYGHNAYGTSDLRKCSKALLYTFIHAFPDIADLIDHKQTEVIGLDVTNSAHLQNSFQCKQVIKSLSEVSTGHSRSTRSFEDTASWNYGSDLCAKIAYLKEVEVTKRIREIKKEMKSKNHSHLQRQLDALASDPVQTFIKNCVRFEAKYRLKYFKRHNIPTNLYKLIEHSENNPNFIKQLWEDAFLPIFNAFEGNMIDLNDTQEIYKLCVDQFGVTKTLVDKFGNKKTVLVETKAKNIYSFFILIKSQGYDFVRSCLSESTFYRKLADLKLILSEAQIRTLNSKTSNIVSLLKIVNVDFSKQHPVGYIDPTNILRLVS